METRAFLKLYNSKLNTNKYFNEFEVHYLEYTDKLTDDVIYKAKDKMKNYDEIGKALIGIQKGQFQSMGVLGWHKWKELETVKQFQIKN